MKKNFLWMVAALVLAATPARTAVPNLVNFQGQLADAAGNAVTSPKSVAFRLFAAASGGSALFTETQTVTPDSGGLYNVNIGAVASLSGVNFNQDLWLEVEVGGETLTPRYRLTSSPYAFRAATANAVDWGNITNVPVGFSDGTDDGAGGPLGADSVGSSHIIDSTITASDLANNAVTGAKIMDGEIANADVSASAAIAYSKLNLSGGVMNADVNASAAIVYSKLNLSGSLVNADLASSAAIALSKLEKDPSQSGTINTSTNPVDWTQLKNVPAGFSDGVDAAGGGSMTVQVDDADVDTGVASLDFTGAQFDVTSSPSGEANVSLDASSVTLMGNAFNGNSQLVQLDSFGKLPALDGSALTGVSAGGISDNAVTSAKVLDGTLANADVASGAAIAYSKLNLTSSVTGADLATGSVGGTQIIDSTITASDLADGAVTSAKVLDGTLVNADVNASAAIAYSKLNLAGSVTSSDLASGSVGGTQIIDSTITASDLADGAVTSAKVLDGTLVNADINASAAIALSKLEKDPSQSGTINTAGNPVDWTQLKNVPSGFADGSDDGTAPGADSVGTTQIIDSTITASDLADGAVTSAKVLDGTLVNADLNASAAIAYSKLSLTGGVVNADVSGSAAIAYSKLNLMGSVTSSDLTSGSVGGTQIIDSTITVSDLADGAVTSAKVLDGTLVNADVNSSAAIAYSKLNLSGSVTSSDLASGSVGGTQIIDSTITASDLADDAVTSAKVLDGALVNADVNSSAAIAYSKLNLSGSIVNADISSSAEIGPAKINGGSFQAEAYSFPSGATIAIGGGTAITKHLSATASLDFGATSAGTCDSLTITVTGAADGDTVALGIPNALATSSTYQSFYGFVSAADTVTVKRCNLTNTITPLANPSAATVRADVWQH